MTTRPGLGDILVEERLIAREQLNQAKRAAERLGSPLVAVLLEQGLITEEAMVEALRRRLHLELYDPVRNPVDLDAVREVPFEEANRYRLLPIQVTQRGGERVLRVAMANPLDPQAIEDLEFSTGCTVEPLIARPSHLADAIRHHYRGVITKIVPRTRAEEPTESPAGMSPAGMSPAGMSPAGMSPAGMSPPRRAFGGELDDAQLHTKPISKATIEVEVQQRVEALVKVLVRKGLVSQEEYETELLALVRDPAEGQ